MHRQFQRVKERAHYQSLPQNGVENLDPEGGEVSDDDYIAGSCHSWRRKFERRFPDVEGDNFNIAVGVVIVINATVLGLETDLGQGRFVLFEHIFAVFFTVEMVLRFRQLGAFGHFSKLSNVFDCLLVCTGDFDLWLCPFLVEEGASQSSGARVMKLLRMFRVMRIVRLFKMFHQLQIILEAFVNALSSVMWVGLLTLILNYVCAIFLTQTIGHHADMWGEEKEPQIRIWFGTIGHSLRTLFIIITLAEWDEIALVLSEQINGVVVFTFAMGYITITSFTMVSLITGIICEELVGSQREDEVFKLSQIERSKKQLFLHIRELLASCDEDGGGTLDAGEIKRALEDPQLKLMVRFQSLEIDMEMNDFLALIEKLKRACGSECVPIDNVAHALEHLSGHASSSSVWDVKMMVRMGQKRASDDGEKVLQKIEELRKKAKQERFQTMDTIDNALHRIKILEQNYQSNNSQRNGRLDKLKTDSCRIDDELDKLMNRTTHLADQHVKLQAELHSMASQIGDKVIIQIDARERKVDSFESAPTTPSRRWTQHQVPEFIGHAS